MKYIHFFFCLLLGMAVQAQIKIGDNPQNIDPSSVLELESSSRVLVITRVNTAQMNAIIPSAGAMVYNTDIQCIHYYTGTEWKDICDAVAGSITFTSDDGTVVITSTGGNNYDLKVGQITGMNIVNETVFGADIATATIGERQLAPNSVGASELQDNTVGKDEIQEAAVGTLEIIDGTIQPSDMQPGAFNQILTTDAGGNVVWLNKNELGATQTDQTTITGAGTAADPIKVADTVIGDILANANNISQNSADIAANTAALGTKEDVANKSDDTNLGNSTTLYPTQNAVKTYVDLAAGAVSSLNNANIFVGNAGNVATGVAMSGDATINNTGVVTIANNAVTNDKLDKANIPLSGFGAAAAPVSLGTNRLTNVANPTATDDAATKAYVDAQVGGVGGTGDITSNDLTITNGINAAFNDVNLEITAGAVGTAELADNSVNSTKIIDGAVQTADIANNSVTPIKIESPGAPNQMLTTDGANAVTWLPIAAGSTELADQVTIVGDGTSGNEFTVANNSIAPNKIQSPGAANQMLTTDGANTVTWVPIAAGSTELADQITIIGDGTTGNEFEVANGSINSNKITDGTISHLDIAPDAIRTPAILNANVTPIKIAPGTNGQVLSTAAGAVTWAALPTGSTEEADGTTITGIGTNADPFKIEPSPVLGQFLRTEPVTGNVIWDDLPTGTAGAVNSDGLTIVGDGVASDLQVPTGGITSTQILDLAITTIDIADNNVTPAKIEQGAAGQVLTTDGTGDVVWAAPAAGSVAVDGTTITGDGNLTDLSVPTGGITSTQIFDGTITTVDIAEDAVTTAKILNAAILAEDLNQMGATANQVLKWNGTAWAPAADAAGTTITPGTGLTLNGTDFDVDDLAGEVTGPTSATVIANNAVTTAKIANAAILAEDLNQMGATANQVLKWNGTAWAPAADAAGTTITPGTGLTLNGTDFDVDDLAGEVTGPTSATVIANNAVTTAKIANAAILAEDLNQMGATANQVLKWNGTAWAPAADVAGTPYNAGIGLTLNGTDLDVDDLAGEVTGPTSATVIANDAVTSAKIAPNTIIADDINTGAVTSDEIFNATILAEDLNQMGAANDQVLKWNGTVWAPAADAGGTTYTAGIGLSLNGTDFDVDDLAGEVTGPTSATVIANNAVTSAKIANATITAEDLNQMGAANDQVLKWNGTVWAPAADAGGTVYTAGIGLSLNGTDFDVDDLAGEVTGPTSATVIANNAVTSAKIANATITAEDLNQMGAANDQVLKWNGTVWAPAADAGGTVYTAGIGLSLNGTDFDVDDLAGEVTGPTSATVIANNAVTSAKIANATITAEDLNQMGAANDQVLKWNGTVWAPAADAGGTVYTAGIGLSLNGTDFDVDDLAGEVTGPTSATVIANNAVTSAKIANATITAEDLNQMGAANDQVLKWNGTVWAPAADAGGTVYTAGIGLSLNGTDFDVDDLAGEVTGPTSATVIANNAVTSAKIANGTISAEDLNQMGAANDQVLKWNGTVWAPAADAGGTAYTAGSGLTLSAGNEFAIGTSSIQGSFMGTSMIIPGTIGQADIGNNAIGAGEIDSNAVSSDEIDDDSIMDVDINSAAGIAGTKITPNFGAQNIVTTGNVNGDDITATGDINVAGSVFRAAIDLHPDYVFQKYFLGNSDLKENYDFQNLAQIEAFVKKYHHLPGIKSAMEVKKDGVWDIGASNLQNLEKIEELFLHTIEQEKKIDQLKNENQSLSAELQSLRKDMDEIKALLKNKN